ncbi:MAG: transcription antitermination factor NusB [Planctomycetota bacterium]
MTARSRARIEAHRLFSAPERGFVEDRARARAGALPPSERPLFRELCAGVLRRRVILDLLLDHYLSSGRRYTDERLAAALRIGLYELLFLDGSEPRAVVHECVELVPTRLGRRARGLVNGVLRRVDREARREAPGGAPSADLLELEDRAWRFPEPILPDPDEDALGHAAAVRGFTREAAARLESELGPEGARALMRNANRRPVPTLRPDPRRLTAEEAVARLREEQPGAEVTARPDHPAGLLAARGLVDLAQSELFRAGLLVPQGDFAARVAPFVAPRDGERILDLCAAPGGKTAHLASLAPAARIVAGVLDRAAANEVRETCRRAAVTAPEILHVAADGDRPIAGPWDAILVDAPCSNSGVLARRPEARHRLTPDVLSELAALQTRLLRVALATAAAASDDCRVIYATCSVLGSENRAIVDRGLAETPGFAVEAEIALTPDAPEEDGGYAARLRRV